MADIDVPTNLDWVAARANCSIHHVFKELENGVRDDVEKMQSRLQAHEETKFSVTKTAGARFSALRVNDPFASESHSVDFVLSRNQIEIYGTDHKLALTATLTLTNEGHCKLKVGNEELFQWQFRRMALEKLFFEPQTL